MNVDTAAHGDSKEPNEESAALVAWQQRASATPRSAYLHVPFCSHRCGYCNFTVIAGRNDLVDPYLQALEIELRQRAGPCQVDTLYLGGGTPTELAPAALERLFALALEWHPLAPGAEFTVEANPLDLDEDRCAVMASAGVTRISLGSQSFSPEKLRRLDRNHTPEDIAKAVAAARTFARDVSLDLIFAAPNETLDNWLADIEAAIVLAPDHVSTYGLTYERGTQFWSRKLHGELAPLDDELERSMYAEAIDRLVAAGLEHYEVSNFGRAGHRSRHNQVYWTGAPFHAAGPGAARLIAGRREVNHRSATTWIRRLLAGESPIGESETLSPEDSARELLVFGLRRLEGVERAWFHTATGMTVDQLVAKSLARFVAAGLLADNGERIQLTREGLFVSDSLWPEFLIA